MAVWICRAGKKCLFHSAFVEKSKIFLTWDGFDRDLSGIGDFSSLKQYVHKECNDNSKTAICTHACQIRIFVSYMKIGDYVITPASSTGKYSVGIITSNYQFNQKADPFHHSHDVQWLIHGIERHSFSDKMVHTLGAFRTVFELKDDEEFFDYLSSLGIRRT